MGMFILGGFTMFVILVVYGIIRLRKTIHSILG